MENTETKLRKVIKFLRAPVSILVFLLGAGAVVSGIMAIIEGDIKWFLVYLSSGILLMAIGYRMRPPRRAKSGDKDDEDW